MSFGKRRFIPKSTLEKILGAIFAIMIIVVGVLTYKAYDKKRTIVVPDCDQVIPFLTEETFTTTEIDISGMLYEESKTYTFKVTNYNDKYNKIIKASLDYDISIAIDDNNVELELTKDNKDVNLLEGNENLLIRKKVLQANKKQEDYYKLVITAKEDIGKDKKIFLKIFSE